VVSGRRLEPVIQLNVRLTAFDLNLRVRAPFVSPRGTTVSGTIVLMQTLLETERLVLRRFTGDDVDNLVELDSDPEVMHFINGGRPTPRDEVENVVLPALLSRGRTRSRARRRATSNTHSSERKYALLREEWSG